MNLQDKLSFRCEIDGLIGYSLGLKLEKQDLLRVKEFIETQWNKQLCHVIPQHVDKFLDFGIERYHELSYLLQHNTVWSKLNRILPLQAVSEIREMSFMKRLSREFGEFSISDEEGVGWEEMYWRLVRPNQTQDVGPLHADKWFWDLGHGITPSGVKRVKVWIAIVCEPYRNGLCVVPGSHLREWHYHKDYRDGMNKPQIDENEANLNLQLVPTHAGDAIIFNDSLLHRGVVNMGSTTRVSLEFTMFIK